MRDLTGRVERLERKVTAGDDELLVLEVPYSEDMEPAQRLALTQTGISAEELQRRTVVFLARFASAGTPRESRPA